MPSERRGRPSRAHDGPFTLERAIAYATAAHQGAVYGPHEPYINHPLRVMERLARFPAEYRIAAVLHDVIEDTAATLADLKARGCDDALLAALDALTKRHGETYEDYLHRVAANRIATVVKIADNLDNSDERRLAHFSADRAEHFRTKYRNARQFLLGQHGSSREAATRYLAHEARTAFPGLESS